MNKAAIATALDNLRQETPETIWGFLERKGSVADVVQGFTTVQDLALRAKSLIALGNASRRRVPGRPARSRDPGEGVRKGSRPRGDRWKAARKEPTPREALPRRPGSAVINLKVEPMARDLAISVLLAAELDRDPRVTGFRTRALHGQLLKRNAALGWTDGLSATGRARGPIVRSRLPIRPERYRQKLARLAEQLAAETGWTSVQASMYVLTGDIPYVPAIEQSYVYRRRRSGASRVILSVDPARSPGEVAELYSRLRRRVVGSRHRDLTEKHHRLAMFAAMRPRNEPVAVQMAAWNKRFPKTSERDWEFDSTSTYGRDRRQASLRILRPAFAPDLADPDFYRSIYEIKDSDAKQLAELDLEVLSLSGQDAMIPRRRFA